MEQNSFQLYQTPLNRTEYERKKRQIEISERLPFTEHSIYLILFISCNPVT